MRVIVGHSNLTTLRLLTLFAATLLFISDADARDTDILSKQDATTMFQMSREQWNASVKNAVMAGAAKAIKSADGTQTIGPRGPLTH